MLAFVGGLAMGELGPAPGASRPWSSYAEWYGALAPAVVSVTVEEPERRIGSGFAVTDRRVITARHLVVDAETVQLGTADGRSVAARVVGADARTDLALLAVDEPVLVPATLGDSVDLQVGDSVLAIGNPYGLGHSLAVGLVGSRGRTLDPADGGLGVDVEFLQLTIPLNPGNSGGPIFDEDGEVAGVLVGTHAQGQAIAFAVPVELLHAILPALEQGERISRAFLGVRTEAAADGVLIAQVIPSGPAARAGVMAGDRLQAVDGQPVTSPEALRALLHTFPGRSRARLALDRQGEAVELEVTLADWAEHPVVVAGLTLEPLPGTGGRVVAIRPRSRAERAGLRLADVVRTVDGVPVQAPADVQDLLAAGRAAQVEVLREGRAVVVMVE